MKFTNLLTIFLALTIILTSSVGATSSDGTIALQKTNITPTGITYVDNTHVYLLCGLMPNLTCDQFGTNTAVIRWNSDTANYTRNDNQDNGSQLPIIQYPNRVDYTSAFPTSVEFHSKNLVMFGGSGYYIVSRRGGTGLLNTSLYSYNPSTNEFIKLFDSVILDGGAPADEFHINSFNGHSSTPLPNYTYFSVYSVSSSSDQKLFQKTSNNQLVFHGEGDLYGNMLQNINPQSTDKLYFIDVRANSSAGYEYNFSGVGYFGIIDPTNDYFFTSDGNIIYYGNVSLSTNTGSGAVYPVDLSNYANCTNYMTGNILYTDIECINRNNCIFIGKSSSRAEVIGFNGQSCISYQLAMGEEFNTSGKKLYSSAVLGTTNKYFAVTGDNVLFDVFQSSFVAPQCLDSNTYCSQPNNNSGAISCSIANTQHCSQGCTTNSSGAFCMNTGGNNTCNVIGARTCTSTTSYSTCQDSDNDGFYDNNIQTFCGVGEFCQASGTFFATCEPVAGSGTSNNSNFGVVPYAVSDNNTAYSIDQNARTLAVVTSNIVHYQQFYTTGANFTNIARDCQYNEVNIYTSVIQTQLLNGTNYPFSQTINKNARVTLNIIPQDGKYVNVTVLDQLGVSMGRYNIIRDVANKSVKIYYNNGTLLYTDFSVNSFDDLQNLNITFIYDFQSATYNTVFTFDRNIDNKITTQPQLFTGNSISSLTINSTNVTFNSLLEGEIFSTNTGFQTLRNNELSFEPCQYSQTGLYHVRTYSYSTFGAPDYSNFLDYDINVKQLSASSSDVAQSNGQNDLSSSTKMWISLFIILGVMVLISIIGFMLTQHSHSHNTGGLIIVFAMFCGIITTIILATPTINYLPVQIAILIGFAESLMLALGVKIAFFSGHV